MLSQETNLGSHTLFAFETSTGEINVIISLFGLVMYRVIVLEKKLDICNQNFLFTELRIDTKRKEIQHESINKAESYFFKKLNDFRYKSVNICGFDLMFPEYSKNKENEPDLTLYLPLFEMIMLFDKIRDDATCPNEKLRKIFLTQLTDILQSVLIQKKSIKRFVKETFANNHVPVKLNPHASNKKSIVFFYIVYSIGLSEIDKLDDSTFQQILNSIFSNNSGKIVISNEGEENLKNEILNDDDYSNVLLKGEKKS